jgi:hypothetical protein
MELTMFDLKDVNIIEGVVESDEDEYFAALQRAINSGHAWKMQGSYGRAMMDAIEMGKCMLGPDPARDYWGNRVPARDEVQSGTKGSYAFVAEKYGTEWADTMKEVV